jgi:hypothetical protein
LKRHSANASDYFNVETHLGKTGVFAHQNPENQTRLAKQEPAWINNTAPSYAALAPKVLWINTQQLLLCYTQSSLAPKAL